MLLQVNFRTKTRWETAKRFTPNEVQRMTAGTGVMHSEYSSPTDKTHLLQIWILPEKKNLEPEYEQTFFPPEEKQGKLKLVASRGGTDGSVHINQDVLLYSSILANGDESSHKLAERSARVGSINKRKN